jgi:hypothetical protein
MNGALAGRVSLNWMSICSSLGRVIRLQVAGEATGSRCAERRSVEDDPGGLAS